MVVNLVEKMVYLMADQLVFQMVVNLVDYWVYLKVD
jgi:hypothetical protein